MLNTFLFVGLPYVAIVVCIIGTIYRFRSDRYHISALSSQFLEGRKLLWGSAPWHIGILVIFLGHLAAFLFPGAWHNLMMVPGLLITVEVIGIAAAVLSIVGLAVLIVRRLTTARLQEVTRVADIAVLFLLLVQVASGLLVAVNYRWGASWSTGTLSPYVWNLLLFRPDISVVADMPLAIKGHVVGAWLILLLIPFTRLIHIFSIPLQYLARAPLRVVWNNPRRSQHAHAATSQHQSRRLFLKGATGIAASGALLSIGMFDKLFSFFQMPGLHVDDEAQLLETRLKRLHLTAEEKALELERMRSESIFVAKYEELQGAQGKYFIDYAMRPALAFIGKDEWPILISAKCTHLGCTVGNQVDSQGRVLCPCHVSYFSIETGMPNEGAPAKAPLGRIGWVLRDSDGREIASESPRGSRTGRIDSELVAGSSLYIVKRLTPEVA